MDMDNFFGPDVTVVDLRSEDPGGAIDELVDHLVATNKVKAEDRDSIAKAIKHREAAMSTGIGFEVAMPHARTDLVSDVVGVIGRSQKGIDFKALDGRAVRLVVLFLVPKAQCANYLNTIANLARLLKQEDFRQGLWNRFL